MNIAMLLSMAADAAGERRALTSGQRHYRYDELLPAARRAADLFRDSGCRHAVVLGTASPAAPIALFGAAFAGLAYVPLNYRLAAATLQALVDRVAPAYLVADDPYRDALRVLAPGMIRGRGEFVDEALAMAGTEGDPPEDAQAIAVQLFTTGTTGEPKAAVLRHEHLVSYILGSVEFLSADETEATLVCVPPYHIAGTAAMLSSVYAGRRIVQLADFAPAAWLELCQREAVTQAFLVPTMLSRIMDHIDTVGTAPFLPTLRSIAYGGGRMPLRTIERALAMFPHVDFSNAYGLTETSSTICLLGPEDHRAAATAESPAKRRRLSSVGKPLPSVEIEIRDESGKSVPPHTAGEVYVRGPQVSGEYLGRRLTDAEGWFATRDGGFFDEEGYLFLSGRADDVIVRGGENISPGDVEEVLLSHDAVADAAVVGAPSDEWGEAVVAAIVLKEGRTASASELQQRVKASLRSSRVPERIRFETALPYNDMGKLLRREVKRLFA